MIEENKNVDITEKSEVTCVEWFHGYGGNALGLKRAIPGLRSIAVCERDAFVVANMVSKMEKGLLDAVPIWTDVTDFPTEPFGCSVLDLFVASYPCQGFSHAGKRLGTEDHRHLWPYCRKFIGAVRPGWVWLENVEGHVSLGLSTVLADLEEDGYTAAWGIFSASEVGAPHQRKRVFILAYDNSRRLEGSSSGRGQRAGDVVGDNRERGEDVAHLRGQGSANGISEQGQWQEGVAEELGDGNQGGINVWPSRPGERQYAWEPPRVVADGKCVRPIQPEPPPRYREELSTDGGSSEPKTEVIRSISQAQSPMGGNADGPAAGLDFPGCTGLSDSELEEIYGWMVKGTNRTDELRMCGNGVVPQTAERAFRVLYAELTGSQK